MKNKGVIKFFLRVFFAALVLFPFLYLLSSRYDKSMHALRKEKTHWALAQKNKNFDFAFLGSSRVYNCLDTRIIDSTLNSRSINLGVGGSAYPENYMLLYSFLKQNNKVKTLFVQVDLWGLIPGKRAYSHSFSEEKYLHLVGDPVIDSVYCENSNRLKFFFRKYCTFFKYSEFNSIYSFDKMSGIVKRDTDNPEYDKSGNRVIDGVKPGQCFTKFDISDLQGIYLSDTSIRSLYNLVGLARKHNVEVVFFTSPSYKKYMSTISLYPLGQKKISEITNELKIDYFDFEQDSICSDSLYFRDFTHLNKKGAAYFSKKFASNIQKYIHD